MYKFYSNRFEAHYEGLKDMDAWLNSFTDPSKLLPESGIAEIVGYTHSGGHIYITIRRWEIE